MDTTDGNSSESNSTGPVMATVTGIVSYNGIVPGPAYVWALEANGSKAAEKILAAGEGNVLAHLPTGKSYDFKAFIDGTGAAA